MLSKPDRLLCARESVMIITMLASAGLALLLAPAAASAAAVASPRVAARAPAARRSALLASGDYDFALLFDCDGVLAETERDVHRPSFNEAFKEKGLETEWDVERYGVLLETGGGKERMKRHWDEVGWPAEYADADEDARWGLCKELHARKTELFMKRVLAGEVPYRPRVLATIDDCITHGVPVGVCSTSNEKAVQAIVDKMGEARSKHIRIFAGDVVPKKKPAPDVYELAAREMELDPTKCVVVEDTNIGLRAAKGAKMGCVITKSIYTQDEDFGAADAVWNDLSFVDLDVLQEVSEANRARSIFGVA